MLNVKTIRISVRGKVQGVFFRQSACRAAQEMGVTGSVKNCADGSVELMATGTEEQLQQLTDWCRKGPPRARVEGIEIADMEWQPYADFIIIR